MGLRRFYSGHEAASDRIRVDGDEYHHLATVLRVRPGERIEVVNGRGRLLEAVVDKLERHFLLAAVCRQEVQPQPAPSTIIAVSLTKPHAMGWMMEKLCELGMNQIRPLLCERTDARFRPALLEKWQKIAIQALKANRQLWLTEIFPAASLASLASSPLTAATRLFLDIDGPRPNPTLFPLQPGPVVALIGPPGDFTPEEKERLKNGGWQSLKINDAILKTETAAIAMAAILRFYHD